MPVDYSQLLVTLIEETRENLADIDEALLSFDLNTPQPEKIDKLFRTIHTIKGNSALFKLESIGKLMHVIETRLDEARKGKKNLTKQHIDILLKISDGIRTILAEIQNKKPINESLIANLMQIFQAVDVIAGEEIVPVTQEQSRDLNTIKKDVPIGWHISIQPQHDIFKKNLSPIAAFQALQEEVHLKKVILVAENLPSFESFDPLNCYLGWELDLLGEISKERILEILTWVFEEKDIRFVKITQKDFAKIKIEKKEIKENAENTDKLQTAAPAGKAASNTITAADEKALRAHTTLRVSTQKIDALMNAVGELVIIESMLKQAIKKIDPKHATILDEPLDLLDTNFRYLQDTLLGIRMVPIAFAINRFPRMIFEMSSKMEKEVNFVIKGDQTEIDKNMIEKITDPLLHLIRNAIDHGIELPSIREEKGKNKIGTLQFIAYQEGDSISIEIKDDGAGLDPEKIRNIALTKGLLTPEQKVNTEDLYQFIFKPGFSTADHVTEFSGRGVGLDVVEKNIRALGGTVHVSSTLGIGTTFKLRLPLTLAIMDCQLIRLNQYIYIIPLLSIIEMALLNINNVSKIEDKLFYEFHNQKIEMIILENILHDTAPSEDLQKKVIIVVQSNGKHFALVADELLIQQPVVIKTLEDNFCRVPGIVGATIMGDGEIGLILDVKEIIDIANHPDIRPLPAVKFFSRKFTLNGKPANQTAQISGSERSNEYLCFALGNEEYAINMMDVREINFSKKPQFLPFTPPYVAGVINLRGSIIPVVDLRLFFNIKNVNSSHKGLLIIVEIEKDEIQKTIGLIVDAITDTQSINRLEISPIPKTGHLTLSHYIQGLVYVNQRIITLLQIQNLVDTETY